MSLEQMRQLDRLQQFDRPLKLSVEEYMQTLDLPEQVKANSKQVSGKHYKEKNIQPWDYIYANNLCYFTGNCVKYVSRWKDKGGVADLKKAIHYLEKLIELEESKKQP